MTSIRWAGVCFVGSVCLLTLGTYLLDGIHGLSVLAIIMGGVLFVLMLFLISDSTPPSSDIKETAPGKYQVRDQDRQ